MGLRSGVVTVVNKPKEPFLLSSIRWLVAIFFIASPLSPFVANTTLYLWIPLIFLDVQFIKSFERISISIALCVVFWISLCLIFFRIDIAMKSAVLIIGIYYLIRIGDNIMNKLYVCMMFSIFWCILQFSAFHISPIYSAMLGPGAISKFFWGEYATHTYTNQFAIFLFPRMSGLSREAGFFASLLVIFYMIRVRDHKLNIYEKIMFLLGFVFSLSKASVALFVYYIAKSVRPILNKVPVIAAFFAFIIIFISLANILNIGTPQFFYANESITHRLSASYLMFHTEIKNLLVGCNSSYQCIVDYQPMVDFLSSKGLPPAVGLSGVVMDMGLIGLISIIFFFVYLKLDSYDATILILFTATVSFFTVDGFIILTYYYIITNHRRNIEPMQG